jgi:hypothetical protein
VRNKQQSVAALSLLLTIIIDFYRNIAVINKSIYSYAKIEKNIGHVNRAMAYCEEKPRFGNVPKYIFS